MTKILKKDIVRLCNCIQGLSYQHIKENEKGCFNHNIISWYNIKPYTCKEVYFLFYKDDYKIVLTADNKKGMYIKLLELYEKGLNTLRIESSPSVGFKIMPNNRLYARDFGDITYTGDVIDWTRFYYRDIKNKIIKIEKMALVPYLIQLIKMRL